MSEKLDNKLETKEIKQTVNKRPVIPFRDSAIENIKKTNTDFGTKRFKKFKFDVSKGTSLKGLLLRFSNTTSHTCFCIRRINGGKFKKITLNKQRFFYVFMG